jgi:hypothetical protein
VNTEDLCKLVPPRVPSGEPTLIFDACTERRKGRGHDER